MYMYMYMYMYTHTYIEICIHIICIYIYIYTSYLCSYIGVSVSDTERHFFVMSLVWHTKWPQPAFVFIMYVYIHTHMYIYIYIYIYVVCLSGPTRPWAEPKLCLEEGVCPWVGSTDPTPVTLYITLTL